MYTFNNISRAELDAEFGLGLLERLATRAKADIATTGNVLKDLVTRQAWTDPDKRSSYENLNQGYRQATNRVKDAFAKAEANALNREMQKTAADTSLRDIKTGKPYIARNVPSTVTSTTAIVHQPTDKGGLLAKTVSRRGLLGKTAATVAATAAGGLIPAKQALDTATLVKTGKVGGAINKAKETAKNLGYAAKIPMALDKIDDMATKAPMSRRTFLKKYGLVLKEAAGQMYPNTVKVLDTLTGSDLVTKAAVKLAKKYTRK